MASGLMEFRSAALVRPARFRFICPNDMWAEAMEKNPHYKRPMKTLYLLHGFTGGCNDWIESSNVLDFAQQYNLMIICPDGENSFYLDRPGTGGKYATYVGKELVDYTRKTFGLSTRREDTYIGGFSMGGFGALHTALAFPDTFSKAICLSSALIIHNVEKMEPGFVDPRADYDYYRYVFGDPKKVAKSEANPEYLIEQLLAQKKNIPGLYLAIGTEDFLYAENQQFRKFLDEHNVPYTYEEGPGFHDYGIWTPYCRKGIEWMLSDGK